METTDQDPNPESEEDPFKVKIEIVPRAGRVRPVQNWTVGPGRDERRTPEPGRRIAQERR